MKSNMNKLFRFKVSSGAFVRLFKMESTYFVPEFDTVAFGSVLEKFWSECRCDELCGAAQLVDHVWRNKVLCIPNSLSMIPAILV